MKLSTAPSFLFVVISALLTGCADLSFLEPAPDQTRYYYLQETDAAYTGDGGLSILIGPAGISRHLDRPGIAVFPEKNVITYSSTNRWAEPLADSINRFLASVLTSELNTTRVGTQRDMGRMDFDYRVGYHIHQLGGRPGDSVELHVSWWIQGRDDDGRRFEGSRFSTTASAEEDYDTYVEALRGLVREWGEEIAETINNYPPPHAESP